MHVFDCVCVCVNFGTKFFFFGRGGGRGGGNVKPAKILNLKFSYKRGQNCKLQK